MRGLTGALPNGMWGGRAYSCPKRIDGSRSCGWCPQPGFGSLAEEGVPEKGYTGAMALVGRTKPCAELIALAQREA